jgi:carboxylesterase
VSIFEASVKRARELKRYEQASPKINPACGSILLEHGHAVSRAVAFMHGITSSPVQFRQLGELFFERGYNVFIPRMPRHGYADRLTRDQANLTVAEFKAYAAQTVEIARGLGEHLTVAGLSVSGVLAAWCAQTRSDVDLAVPISPAFGPHLLPFPLVPGLARLLKLLPNVFVWWDFRLRAAVGHPCGYPRFSTHAMAESFQLGLGIYRAARTDPPDCRQILVVTNPRDMAVDNSATRAVVRRWRAHLPIALREYQFGRDLGPLHDIIGPYQPKARVDTVYPILFDLIASA